MLIGSKGIQTGLSAVESVIEPYENIRQLLDNYVRPMLKPGDIVVLSEKMVAITQGRGYPIDSIKPSWLARMLSRFVFKSPYGIGLGSPWTMELAIREAGKLKILLATIGSAITKLFGIKGVFYRICGKSIAAIDGPCSYTLPPYNQWVVMGPKYPQAVAEELSQYLQTELAIVDANDLGVVVLGSSLHSLSTTDLCELLRDNPLGQSKEQTPIGIIRLLR
jgi:F420-0:gamma-glutamyl ligase-like protein